MVLNSGRYADGELVSEVLVGEQVWSGAVTDLGFSVVIPVFRSQQSKAVLAEMSTTRNSEECFLLVTVFG